MLRKLLAAFVFFTFSAPLVDAQAQVMTAAERRALQKLYQDRFLGKMYECLMNGLQQGLNFTQAIAACDQKIEQFADELADGGGRSGSLAGLFGGAGGKLDGSTVTSACQGIDPTIAGGDEDEIAPLSGPVFDAASALFRAENALADAKKMHHALFEAAAAAHHKANATAREAERTGNKDHIDSAAETKADAEKADKKAQDSVKKEQDAVNKAAAHKKQVEAAEKKKKEEEDKKKKDEEAKKKADGEGKKDDGKKGDGKKDDKPKDDPKKGRSASNCQTIVAMAKEIARQCRRTKNQSVECQRLFNNCDITTIYVSGEEGFVCPRLQMNAEDVKNAYVAECVKNTTPGPDGKSPCDGITVSDDGRSIVGANPRDVCKPGNPKAYIVDGGQSCYVRMEWKPDIPMNDKAKELIVWITDFAGGPIIVLPKTGPTPFPPRGDTTDLPDVPGGQMDLPDIAPGKLPNALPGAPGAGNLPGGPPP